MRYETGRREYAHIDCPGHADYIKNTHHPVDDVRGNAEALLQMKEMGLKISFT